MLLLTRPKRIAIILISLLVLSGLWILLATEKPVAVDAAVIARGIVEYSIANTRAGTLKACRRARLAPANGGQIANLYVQEGDKVNKDQLLLEMWNDNLAAQLALAKQEAQSAKSQAEEVCIKAEVTRKEAKRSAKLVQQNLTSIEDAERLNSLAKSAQAACDAANSQQKVSMAKITVIQVELERTKIRAPFTGIIAEINGEVGEFVTPSPVGVATLPVVDLIDNQCIYVEAPIDEVDAPLVKVGLNARITLDAFAKHPFDAIVQRISPYVQDFEKQARTVNVEVRFAHMVGEQNMLPGYSADAEIILEVKENVLRAPTQAIVDETFVYVVSANNHALEKVKISKGIGNWAYTEVLSGLNEGDTVVTSVSQPDLRPGLIVEARQK